MSRRCSPWTSRSTSRCSPTSCSKSCRDLVANPADPWASVTTSTGLPADEVISTLQKSIRRGEVRNAVLCALDLSATSPELDTYLWDRLHVIAVEDVGFGNPQAIAVIVALDTARQRFDATVPRPVLVHDPCRSRPCRIGQGPIERRARQRRRAPSSTVAGGLRSLITPSTCTPCGVSSSAAASSTSSSKVPASTPELESRERRWRTELLAQLGLPADE